MPTHRLPAETKGTDSERSFVRRQQRRNSPGNLYPNSIDPDPPPKDESLPTGYGLGPSWTDYYKPYPGDNRGWAASVVETIQQQWRRLSHVFHYPEGKHPSPEAHSFQRHVSQETRRIGPTGMGWMTTPVQHPVKENAAHFRPYVQSRTPQAYLFYRDMSDGPKRLNGMHFSMATNIRAYPIGGMRPTHSRRNTYRQEPAPRDEKIAPITANEATLPADQAPYTPIGGPKPNAWRL